MSHSATNLVVYNPVTLYYDQLISNNIDKDYNCAAGDLSTLATGWSDNCTHSVTDQFLARNDSEPNQLKLESNLTVLETEQKNKTKIYQIYFKVSF